MNEVTTMLTREQREYLISQLFIQNGHIKIFFRLHSLYAERDYGAVAEHIFWKIKDLYTFIGDDSLAEKILSYISYNKNDEFYTLHANKQPIDFDVMDVKLDRLFKKLFYMHSFHVVCEISLTDDDIHYLKYYKKEVKALLKEYKDFYIVKPFMTDDCYYFFAKSDTTKIFELGQGYTKRLIEEHLNRVTFSTLLTTNSFVDQPMNEFLL